MKRYVTEFANDIRRDIHGNPLMQTCYKVEKINRISDILQAYYNGYISPVEAVKCLANVMGN